MFACILQVHMSGYFHITLTPLVSVLVSTLFTVNTITYQKQFSQKVVFMGRKLGEFHITTGWARWPGSKGLVFWAAYSCFFLSEGQIIPFHARLTSNRVGKRMPTHSGFHMPYTFCCHRKSIFLLCIPVSVIPGTFSNWSALDHLLTYSPTDGDHRMQGTSVETYQCISSWCFLEWERKCWSYLDQTHSKYNISDITSEWTT